MDSAEYDSQLSEVYRKLGLSRSASLVFASVFRHASPPCADELVEDLGLSRSNISSALRELRNWGLLEVSRAPNDRRDRFSAPDDQWVILRRILTERDRQIAQPVRGNLRELQKALGGPGKIKRIDAALGLMDYYQQWVQITSELTPELLSKIHAFVKQESSDPNA